MTMYYIGEIDELCRALKEMAENCDDDLCGDHRKFYNPRIKKGFLIVSRIFPKSMAMILNEKNPLSSTNEPE